MFLFVDKEINVYYSFIFSDVFVGSSGHLRSAHSRAEVESSPRPARPVGRVRRRSARLRSARSSDGIATQLDGHHRPLRLDRRLRSVARHGLGRHGARRVAREEVHGELYIQSDVQLCRRLRSRHRPRRFHRQHRSDVDDSNRDARRDANAERRLERDANAIDELREELRHRRARLQFDRM